MKRAAAMAPLPSVTGEALLLDPPIRFRTMPGALRVLVPPAAASTSPES